MKKRLMVLIIVLIFLFSLNFCLGIIRSEDNIKEEYNLGDVIETSGDIFSTKDSNVDFKIKIICSDQETLLMIKKMYLKKNTLQKFEENLFIPYFSEEICKLKYELFENNNKIEEKESKELKIVKKLNTRVILENELIQLGETILLKGEAKKLNDEKINGNALISIKKDNENYLIVNSEINKGVIEKEIGPILIPNGDYFLTINIRDVHGNEGKVENLPFKVLTKIELETKINKINFVPGEKIKITGSITNLKEISDEFELRINLNDQNQEKIIPAEFEQEFKIQENTKSLINKLIIKVFDNYGNVGEDIHEINIIPQVKEIKMDTDKKEYEIDNTININISLIDQANDIINDDVKLIIKNNLFTIDEMRVNTKETIKYKVKDGLDGEEIRIITEYNDLKNEKEIQILETDTTNKEKDYITGNFAKELGKNLSKLGYVMGALILLVILVFVLSHSKLKKDVKHMFKKKHEKHEKVKKQLQNKIKKKHKEKKQLEKTFHTYIDPVIAKRLVQEKGSKEGIKKNITVLFADMRGFTRLSENTDPEKVVDKLNLFHKAVSDSIKMYNGIVDQIVGDEVFALFNVVKEDGNHALNAAKAAIKVRSKINEINKKLKKENKKLIKVGIGVNSGEVMLGNIGSDNMLRYTAIGNTVNLGSRLQSKAKHNQILITEETYKILKKDIEVEDLGYMNFKNISKQVSVYNVIGLK